MNKVILTGIAALLFAGIAPAQSSDFWDDLWTEEQLATSKEYQQLAEEWREISGVESVGRDDAFGEMYQSIREDYPMPDEIRQKEAELQAECNQLMEAAAKKNGFSSVTEAFKANDQEVIGIYNDYAVYKITPVTQPYWNELSFRYHVAAIDALKRLIENANAMK